MAKRKPLPTYEQVRELLDYDPVSGVLRWKATGIAAGYEHPSGYILVKINGACTSVHRLAWCWMTGAFPSAELDHINLNKADNRWVNLREATHRQNSINRMLRSDNKLRIKGVSQSNGKFRARITVNGRLTSLGTFATIEEASRSYAIAAAEFHGAFANAY